MKKYLPGLLFFVSLLMLPGVLMAAGDAAAAQGLVPLCQGCHGQNGEGRDAASGMPAFPRLAGQIEHYLVQTLNDYKNGTRTNPLMDGIAKGLSAGDIANLAAYYTALK